jgi:hypothetical protein
MKARVHQIADVSVFCVMFVQYHAASKGLQVQLVVCCLQRLCRAVLLVLCES